MSYSLFESYLYGKAHNVILFEIPASEIKTDDWTMPKPVYTKKGDKGTKLIVIVGFNEGPIPHFHIVRNKYDPATWKYSIRLQMLKSEYFERPKVGQKFSQQELDKFNPWLTRDEIRAICLRLDSPPSSEFEDFDTWWDVIIYQWNNVNGKRKGDRSDGWVPPGISRPIYESGIGDYKGGK